MCFVNQPIEVEEVIMPDERIDMFKELMEEYLMYKASLLFDDKCLTITVNKASYKEEMSCGYVSPKERFGVDVVIEYGFKVAFDVVPRLKENFESTIAKYGYTVKQIDERRCYLNHEG